MNPTRILRELLCISFLCAQALITFAGPTTPVEPALVVTQAQLEQLAAQLPKTPKNLHFTHWTSFSTWLRWARQGEIDAAEMAVLNSGAGLAGGGLYLAEDTDGSRGFGDFALEFFAPQGTLMYDENIVAQILGRTSPLSNEHKVQLGQKLPFLHHFTTREDGSRWWVTHTPSLASKRGDITPLYNAHFRGIPFGNPSHPTMSLQNLQDLQAIGAGKGAENYLRHLLAILYSKNIHGFLQALYESPGNLTAALSPQTVLRIEATLYKWFKKPTPTPISTKEVWVQNQLTNILPALFSDLTGQPATTMFRSFKRSSPTITVDSYQLEFLKRNPLISLRILSQVKLQSQVQWNYLAPERVTTEMREWLGRAYEQVSEEISNPNIVSELAAIAPFSSENDLVTRTYLSLLRSEFRGRFGGPTVGNILSIYQTEEEPLLTPNSQTGIATGDEASSLTAQTIAQGLITELFDAQRENRMPRYQDLPEQTHYPRFFTALRPKAKTVAPKRVLQTLSNRNYKALSEMIAGHPFWISNYEILQQVVSEWSKRGDWDLVQSLRTEIENTAKLGLLTPRGFEMASLLEWPGLTRAEWIQRLLDLISETASPTSRTYTIFTILSNIESVPEDKLLKEICHRQLVTRIFPRILALAQNKQYKKVANSYLSQLLNFADIERKLQLERKDIIGFARDLITAFSDQKAEPHRDALTNFVLFSTFMYVTSEADLLEILPSLTQYLNFDLEASVAPMLFKMRLSYLALTKQMTAPTLHKVIAALVTPKRRWVKSDVPSFLDILELSEKTFPDEFQKELHWFFENLDSLVEDQEMRKTLRERVQKLLKPIGIIKPLSVRATPSNSSGRAGICSPLVID